MKQSYIFLAILLLISLIVVPIHAFTAEDLTIAVQQNGDAEFSFKYQLSWIEWLTVRMGIANPQNELRKLLVNNFNKPVTIIRVDGSEAQFIVNGFANVKTDKETITLTTPSTSFSAAENVLKGYWFAPLINTDFSPSVTKVSFPDRFSKEFYDQISIPKVGHTFERYVHGIDVSQNQGKIEWDKVKKAGFEFAYIRASWGDGQDQKLDYIDDNFQMYIRSAKSNNLFVGAYHIAYPDPYENDDQFLNEADAEANQFLKVAGDYVNEGYLRPALDIEPKLVRHLTKNQLAKWINQWNKTIYTKTGVKPILYFSNSIPADDSLVNYDLWIAYYPLPQSHDKEIPNRQPSSSIWPKWQFWQYSEEGIVNGIEGNVNGYVDLDLFNGNINDFKNNFVI